MEARSVKQRKRANGFHEQIEVDRISHLPDSLLHHILLFLPVKTIARTSVLSKRWRSLWLSLPDLDFTSINSLHPCSHDLRPTSRSSFSSSSIHQVLALRHRDSGLRALRLRTSITFSQLNALIRLAITHHIQELDVEVATNDYFNFPRRVITSQCLRVLKLKSSYPGFRLPPSSAILGGFHKLKTLFLSLVILYNQPFLLDFFTDPSFPLLEKLNLEYCFGLKQLKVSCSQLQELTLENCFQLDGLEVSGNKLKRLKVGSCFDAYTEESWAKINAPNLRSFLWESNAVTAVNFSDNSVFLQEASVVVFMLHQDVKFSQIHSLLALLSGLSHTKSLELGNQCIEILSSKKISTHLQPFQNMRSLELRTCFNRHNVHALASLFKSCLKLKTLLLNIINEPRSERRQWNKDLWNTSTSEVEQYWESQTEDLNPFLQNIKVVEIDGFLECENEVSLAMFLLKHGKALKRMTLRSGCLCRDSLRRQMIRSQMMGFSRASSSAKISFH
ncbi:PREDICTED: putative F-box/FBD/LRR-repeat protein At4g03220 [Tarenaya hassleriana]|uniref:putative F-box/FBD/LRR-repeat protein At4g03220 n=1 Tax=Tarenaya hassleriana TaxID=28532 RepID=UPI00053C3CF1|nr:PREDICTED: putative F-box/FBD/LRR-repeat protein At4g03220 [Tarenaya hassleriana]